MEWWSAVARRGEERRGEERRGEGMNMGSIVGGGGGGEVMTRWSGGLVPSATSVFSPAPSAPSVFVPVEAGQPPSPAVQL